MNNPMIQYYVERIDVIIHHPILRYITLVDTLGLRYVGMNDLWNS